MLNLNNLIFLHQIIFLKLSFTVNVTVNWIMLHFLFTVEGCREFMETNNSDKDDDNSEDKRRNDRKSQSLHNVTSTVNNSQTKNSTSEMVGFIDRLAFIHGKTISL